MKMISVRNKKYLQTTLILNLILFASCFLPVYVFAQKTVNKKLTPREIAQQTLPSTVLLVMSNSDTEEIKSGSGFFIAEDIVVTNFHVVKETTEGYAKIYGQDKIYKILGVVGIDEKNDLALLKIKGIKGKPLKLNTDDSVAIGDEVFAVGNPKGLEGTFSQGIISSIRKTGKFNLLQITASISAGSSGGAVLNDKGEVIGVAVGAIESGQSLNFAIPVSLLRPLISDQKLLKSLASNATVAENKVQPIRKIDTKLPNNIPKIKPVLPKTSRMQFKTSDLVEENLFGNVKSIKESTYKPEKKFEKWVLGEAGTVLTKRYNLDGYKEYSEEILYSDDLVLDAIVLTYNFYIIGGGKELPFTLKTLFYYDYTSGLVTVERHWKCASCSTFELERKFLIKYEVDEQTRFDFDGKIIQRQITRKEKDGKTIVENYNADGKLTTKEIIYKNKIGEVKAYWNPSKVNKDQLELTSKTITVETQGQLKETSICIKNGKEVECNQFVLRDKATQLILRQGIGQFITKYEYEFDLSGNWTKQTEYQQVTKFGKTSFEPTKITVREISYY